MANVCLIIPPSPFLLDERVFISLGVLKVAAALEQTGYQVEVLDLSGVKNYIRQVQARVACRPEVLYGITATTPQMPAAWKIAEYVPGWLVLGGPHATLVHAAARLGNARAQEALDKLAGHFDCIIAGDGERAVLEAVKTKHQGIIDADNPKSDLFLTHIGFTESPWPARHLVDMNSYHYEIDGHKATSIVAQLGCPFGCNFCGGRLSPMLRRARLRSTENIVAEMRMLNERYGYTGFMFYDDELNVNPKVLELMKAIDDLAQGRFALRGFVKAELFTEQQAAAMYKAGFKWLLCGFESGSPRILRNINKKATREDNTRMLRIAHDHGIKVKALMSLGHPGESPETIAETKDWLLENKPDDFDATVITVYPGTPYYDAAIQFIEGGYRFETHGDALYHEDIDFNREQAFYKGIPGEYKAYVWTDYLTSNQLIEARDAMEAEVRAKLHLAYPSQSQKQYEQTMGQTK